jgi:hypothetical protein
MQEGFSLRIDHFDGLFQNQEIYVEDKELHVLHNLKESPYNFRSGIGTFNRRFVLRYIDSNSVARFSADNDESNVTAFVNEENLTIDASHNISAIDIYDISGKSISNVILTQKNRNYTSNFYYAEGVYFVKIKLENGFVATKKLIQNKNH